MTITPVITSSAPSLISGSGSSLFMGVTGKIVQVDVTNQVLSATNDSPGSASIFGRIAVGPSGTRIFAGDDAGNLWAIDPSNFTGTNRVWTYQVSGDSIKSSPYYDFTYDVLQFGTEAGKVVALNSSGAALSGFPFTPGSSSDAIQSSLLYVGGILLVGTATGKLFLIDRSTGSGPALVRQYSFGGSQVVSGIGYDRNTSRYMVSTADTSARDGQLYYFDVTADPTPSYP